MTKNPSPVLLDRLSHALDRQGVKLKRQQLLETAAYAFGHRSGDAFSAAAKAGEINPPPVVPIGRVALADGGSVLIVNDPLADAPYGIDESFVEATMDERRESIGVTPYGHLVGIAHLADAAIPDLTGGPAAVAGTSGIGMAGILAELLVEVDEEIENRKHGGDPSAWSDLERLSTRAHAAVAVATRVEPLEPHDPDSIRVSRDDLEQVLGAADSWADDLVSGLADGTYEDDAGVEDVQTSIDTLRTRLSMPAPASAPAPAATRPPAGMVDIHVGTITHRHGEDVRVSLSAEGLDAEIARYCRENWDTVADMPKVPGNPDGMTDAQIVSTYFDACAEAEKGQYVDTGVQQVPVPAGLLTAAPAADCIRCGSGLVHGMCSDETCPFHDVPQDDPSGWAGHPERDAASIQRPRVPAPSVLEGKPADWADQIAQALEDSAVADIWYDASEFGGDSPDDPDRIAEDSIGETQLAMQEAARILRELKPIRLPDGKLMVDGIIPSTDRIASRAEARSGDEPLWITDRDGEDTGQATLTMLHEARIGYHYDNGEFHPLTEREQELALPREMLNFACDNTVQCGYAILWRGRKWLAPEVEFGWDTGQEFLDNGELALGRAMAYMDDVRPMVEALGGHLHLVRDATDSTHELAILLPFELADESADLDDWRAALGYLLSTSREKAARPRVSCEFTAEVNFHKYTMSVEPLGDTVWDGTFDALRWGTQKAIAVITGEDDPDDYASSPLAPAWVREWIDARPFSVQTIGLQEALRIAL